MILVRVLSATILRPTAALPEKAATSAHRSQNEDGKTQDKYKNEKPVHSDLHPYRCHVPGLIRTVASDASTPKSPGAADTSLLHLEENLIRDVEVGMDRLHIIQVLKRLDKTQHLRRVHRVQRH